MDNSSQSRLSVNHCALLGESSERLGLTLECQNGWEGLIDGVLRLVGRYAADTSLEMRVASVKEQFGQLRIYHQGGGRDRGSGLCIGSISHDPFAFNQGGETSWISQMNASGTSLEVNPKTN